MTGLGVYVRDSADELAWPGDEILSAQQAYTVGPIHFRRWLPGDYDPRAPLRRHSGLAAYRYRGAHRLDRYGYRPTVADIRRACRPALPAEPVLVGVHTCRFRFYGLLPASDDRDAVLGTLTLLPSDDAVLTVPALFGGEPPTEPIPLVRELRPVAEARHDRVRDDAEHDT